MLTARKLINFEKPDCAASAKFNSTKDELLGGSRVEESALHFEKHREMRAKWKKKRTRRLKRKRRKMRQRSK
jgi:uncharacterized protein with von Willebrand factor type A (vWA) domain